MVGISDKLYQGSGEVIMNVLWISVAAFLGGIASGTLGYLDSGEAFQLRKFMASVVRALIAAVIFAISYTYNNHVTPIDFGIAFIAGAGVDVLGNRVSGAIKAGLNR